MENAGGSSSESQDVDLRDKGLQSYPRTDTFRAGLGPPWITLGRSSFTPGMPSPPFSMNRLIPSMMAAAALVGLGVLIVFQI